MCYSFCDPSKSGIRGTDYLCTLYVMLLNCGSNKFFHLYCMRWDYHVEKKEWGIERVSGGPFTQEILLQKL